MVAQQLEGWSCITWRPQVQVSNAPAARWLDLFLEVLNSNPAICLYNSQLVCLLPVGILNPLSPKSDQHQISHCNITAL